MNYHEWLDRGFALTSHCDQVSRVIMCKVDIVCRGSLCRDGQDKKITVDALWDTGATITSIDRDLATSLSLIPIGRQNVCHAEGVSVQNTYTFSVNLMSSRFTIDVVKAVSGNFRNQAIKMLIGMDIISLGDFFYGQCRGTDGRMQSYFSFAIPSIDRKIDFVKEWHDGRIKRDGRQQVIRNQPKKKQNKIKR